MIATLFPSGAISQIDCQIIVIDYYDRQWHEPEYFDLGCTIFGDVLGLMQNN